MQPNSTDNFSATKTAAITANQSLPLTELSFLPNIMKGIYIFSAYNSLLPSIPFLVTTNGFAFSGCNDIFIPCYTNSNNMFKVNGQITSTMRQCQINYDQSYIQIIAYADGYGINGVNFYLTKLGIKIVDFVWAN